MIRVWLRKLKDDLKFLRNAFHEFKYSKVYKSPRVYFGRNVETHTWELWIVEWDGKSAIFQDLNSLEDVMNIVNMIPEKYPKYTTKTPNEVTQ